MLETVIPNSAEVERMGAQRAALVDFAPEAAAPHARTRTSGKRSARA